MLCLGNPFGSPIMLSQSKIAAAWRSKKQLSVYMMIQYDNERVSWE